jgi:histidinol-phosphate aminotransferase
LNRVRQPFNTNLLAQAAATASLDDATHVSTSVRMNLDGLDQLARSLDALTLRWIPSVANFLTVDLGRPAQPVYDGLLRQGVIVRPLGSYGLPSHLRITVGTREQNARVLGAIRRVMDGVPGQTGSPG